MISRSIVRAALIATSALTLAATPALAQKQRTPSPAVAAAQAEAERAKLFALFEDADERELALNPLSRLFRGDDENARRLGDYLTEAFFIAGRTDTQLNLAKLALIDRSKLSNAKDVAANAFDKDNQYVVFMIGGTVLVYDTNKIKTPPTSWDDLNRPEY